MSERWRAAAASAQVTAFGDREHLVDDRHQLGARSDVWRDVTGKVGRRRVALRGVRAKRGTEDARRDGRQLADLAELRGVGSDRGADQPVESALVVERFAGEAVVEDQAG